MIPCAHAQDAEEAGLLLADFRALPGMEGSAVFDSGGALVGMVATPLCISGYELPVVIPSAALASAIPVCLPAVPSVSRQPAGSSAAASESDSAPLPGLHQRRPLQQQQEAAAQLECSPCSAPAVAGAVPVAAPAIAALNKSALDVVALLRASRSVVGCSLSNGQWASGVLVNRCPGRVACAEHKRSRVLQTTLTNLS